MRAWFLQGEPNSESDALSRILRQWAGRPENSCWSVDCPRWAPKAATLLQEGRPDILMVAEPSAAMAAWLADVLTQDVGLVLATSLERVEPYLFLAKQYAVQLTRLPTTVEELGLALLNVAASLQRQRDWQARVAQLQQRLNDRVLIERAKGILVERLAISEKEAYQRLRLQSRSLRRPIRDIAQCLLDAQSLFSPEMKESGNPPHHNGQAHWEQSSEEA
jgi:hypothetical protein